MFSFGTVTDSVDPSLTFVHVRSALSVAPLAQATLKSQHTSTSDVPLDCSTMHLTVAIGVTLQLTLARTSSPLHPKATSDDIASNVALRAPRPRGGTECFCLILMKESYRVGVLLSMLNGSV